MHSVVQKSTVFTALAFPFLIGMGGCTAQPGSPEDVASTRADLDISRFQGWTPIPTGVLTSDPAVTYVEGGSGPTGGATGVYGRGMDHAFYFNFFSSITGWFGWRSMGGVFNSAPTATLWNPNNEAPGSETIVLGQGTDGNIYADWTVTDQSGDHPTFQSWTQIPPGAGGCCFVTGAAVTFSNSTLYAAAKAQNNGYYITHNDVTNGLNPAGWAAWAPIPGGFFTSRPAMTSVGGNLVVFGRGGDNHFYYNTSFDGSTWTGWFELDPGTGVFSSAPAVSAHGFSVEVSGTGFDKRIYTDTLNPSSRRSTGFVPIPTGILISGPGSATDNTSFSSNGLFEVVGLGTDNRYYINIWR